MDEKNDRLRASVKKLQMQEEKDAVAKVNADQDDSMTLGDILKDQLKK
jgi:small subunit ribosomal protein S1